MGHGHRVTDYVYITCSLGFLSPYLALPNLTDPPSFFAYPPPIRVGVREPGQALNNCVSAPAGLLTPTSLYATARSLHSLPPLAALVTSHPPSAGNVGSDGRSDVP